MSRPWAWKKTSGERDTTVSSPSDRLALAQSAIKRQRIALIAPVKRKGQIDLVDVARKNIVAAFLESPGVFLLAPGRRQSDAGLRLIPRRNEGARIRKGAKQEQRRGRRRRMLRREFPLESVAKLIAGVTGEMQAATGGGLHARESLVDLAGLARDNDFLRGVEQHGPAAIASVLEQDERTLSRGARFLGNLARMVGGVSHQRAALIFGLWRLAIAST